MYDEVAIATTEIAGKLRGYPDYSLNIEFFLLGKAVATIL